MTTSSMNTAATNSQEINFNILLKALQGLTMFRPMTILSISMFIGFVALLVLSRIGAGIGGFVAVLFAFIGLVAFAALAGAGYLGAGFSLSAVVEERETPGISTSILFGIYTLPRLLGLMLLEGLMVFGLLIVEVILIEICRIPVLGGLLSLVVFPSLFLMNVALTAMFLVAVNLSGPALWFGESVSNALGHVLAVAKSRPGPVFFVLLLLFLLYLIVGGILAALAAYAASFTGALVVGGMGGALQSASYGLSGLMSMFQLPMGNTYGSAMAYMGYHPTFNGALYDYALLIVTAAFFVVVVAIPNTVLQLGLAYLYADSRGLVDREAGTAMVGKVLQKVGSAADAARKKAEEAAQQARQHTQNFAEKRSAKTEDEAVPAAPVANKKHFCNQCGATLEPDEKFCGECGSPTGN
ncbi:zinc ribbon domain-containing protein [Acidithiobacillus montserratensis]|uniref:Zinc ribbon domain-containing protein n=1 Tax=Acidithiobacillus montserratensis TaxID=2729135 RepID=A0ACD5HFN1_9PROT|nr:zinc ribbon domain-containing protein [Acidithiobacillus montserratensis]MBU2749161.1 zinc ribbon domain-containing protein [Acidithiobacillus montserratensis]